MNIDRKLLIITMKKDIVQPRVIFAAKYVLYIDFLYHNYFF